MWSPIGLAARDDSFDEEKKKWIWWDHTPVSKEGSINRSHDPCWLTKEDRDNEGVPAAGSSKFSLKVVGMIYFNCFNVSLSLKGSLRFRGMPELFTFTVTVAGKSARDHQSKRSIGSNLNL